MKKSILLLAFAFFANCYSPAVADAPKPDNRALELTRKLMSALQLNESIYIQVKHLNEKRFQEMDEAVAQFSNNATQKEAKLQQIEAFYNQQIETLLSPNQKATYEDMLKQTASINPGK